MHRAGLGHFTLISRSSTLAAFSRPQESRPSFRAAQPTRSVGERKHEMSAGQFVTADTVRGQAGHTFFEPGRA
jgi:hypothetical protein